MVLLLYKQNFMVLTIETKVSASLREVKSGFDQNLFESLSPPFPRVEKLQFDGNEVGDKVSLILNFKLFKQRWVSEIVENNEDDKSWVFIDIGKTLPFFLDFWRHTHKIEVLGKGSKIIDHVEFRSHTKLFTFFFYPFVLLQFIYRKPKYRKFFQKD